jgi:hypothetical protein
MRIISITKLTSCSRRLSRLSHSINVGCGSLCTSRSVLKQSDGALLKDVSDYRLTTITCMIRTPARFPFPAHSPSVEEVLAQRSSLPFTERRACKVPCQQSSFRDHTQLGDANCADARDFARLGYRRIGDLPSHGQIWPCDDLIPVTLG